MFFERLNRNTMRLRNRHLEILEIAKNLIYRNYSIFKLWWMFNTLSRFSLEFKSITDSLCDSLTHYSLSRHRVIVFQFHAHLKIRSSFWIKKLKNFCSTCFHVNGSRCITKNLCFHQNNFPEMKHFLVFKLQAENGKKYL